MSEKDNCPDCERSDRLRWQPCKDCGGGGLITCICEGAGGEMICGYCEDENWEAARMAEAEEDFDLV